MANTVRITVGVNDQASRPIRDVHDAWKRLQADGSRGLALGLGAAAGLAAWNAAGMAIKGVTDFLGDSVKAALEEEASVAKLNASLKANETAYNADTSAMEKTFQSRMRLGFADDEQRQSAALLLAATHDRTKALDDERIAMDLAAFKGIDLQTASEALIKVEGGHYRVLQALIGSTKDITTSEEALAAVHNATAGAADALANTTGGKLKASNIAINESMEKLGGVLLPAVATGAEVVANVVGTVADVFKGFGDIIGGFGNAVGGMVDDINTASNAHNAEADAAAAYNLALTELQSQFASNAITEDEYRQKSQALDDQYNELIRSTDAFTTGTMTAGDAAAATADQLDRTDIAAAKLLNSVLDTTDATYAGADAFRAYTTDAGETGAGLDNVAGRAIAAAHGFDILASSAFTAAEAEALATQQRLTAIQVHGPSGDIAGARGGMPGFENLGQDSALFLANARQHIQDVEAARRAHEAAARAAAHHGGALHGLTDAQKAAQKAAKDLAAEIDASNKKAFSAAEKAAQSYFDRLHSDNLKAIDDAHKLATARIDAERRAVNEILDERRRALLQPVTEEEQQLRDRQNREQRQHLVEALDAARAGTTSTDAEGNQVTTVDANAVRDATNALEEFDLQLQNSTDRAAAEAAAAAINDNTPVSQAEVDARAKADAAAAAAAGNLPPGTTSVAGLNAAQSAADAKAQADTDAENARFEKQKAAFKAALGKVEDHTKKGADATAAILSLLQGQGVPGYAAVTVGGTGSAGGKGKPKAHGAAGDPMTVVASGFHKADGAVDESGGSAGPDVTVTLNVQLEGAIADSNSAVARAIAQQLVLPLREIFRTQVILTGKGYTSAADTTGHTHPLAGD